MGIAGGINLYAYAGSSPTNFTDPSGLKPREPNNPGCSGSIDGCGGSGSGNGGNGGSHVFLALNGAAYGVAGTLSYVPSSGNIYQSFGVAKGSGASLTIGFSDDADAYISRFSVAGSLYDGFGSTIGLSPGGSWPLAEEFGIGFGAWGATGTYGVQIANTNDISNAITNKIWNGIPVLQNPTTPIGEGLYIDESDISPQLYMPH
jgi:hypothetical protein